MMKRNLKRLGLLLLLGLPVGLLAADNLPKPFQLARYQPMMDRSPFAVATAVAAPAATPNFAKDLYVANAARSKDGDMVTIASTTDKMFKRYLTTTAPSDGYSITSIEWSDKVGATKVTIAKDSQTATLSFNEALLKVPTPTGQNAVPPAAVQPQQPQQRTDTAVQPAAPFIPGVAPQNKPMPVPALPTPPPRVRGVIPKNPAANAIVPEPPKQDSKTEL